MAEPLRTSETRNADEPRGRGWRLEALASGFVALLALLISAYTVYVQRQQLKVQAWPRLTIENESEPTATPGELRVSFALKKPRGRARRGAFGAGGIRR